MRLDRAPLCAHECGATLSLPTTPVGTLSRTDYQLRAHERAVRNSFLRGSVADTESHCAVTLSAWLCSKTSTS